MAADPFESYAVLLVASLILGKMAFGSDGLVFPPIVPMIGVITAVIGIFVVAPRSKNDRGMAEINRGFFVSAGISAILVAIAAFNYLPAHFSALKGVTDASILSHGGSPREGRHSAHARGKWQDPATGHEVRAGHGVADRVPGGGQAGRAPAGRGAEPAGGEALARAAEARRDGVRAWFYRGGGRYGHPRDRRADWETAAGGIGPPLRRARGGLTCSA